MCIFLVANPWAQCAHAAVDIVKKFYLIDTQAESSGESENLIVAVQWLVSCRIGQWGIKGHLSDDGQVSLQ